MSYADTWKKSWDTNQIAFHLNNINELLERNLERLTLNNKKSLRILLPLCGKAVDIAWLASLGHTVIGVEFVESAIEQFFHEQRIKYNIKIIDNFKVFISDDEKIRLYNGDFFNFNSKLEMVDCVWDRGALVALPDELRKRYAPHILTLLESDFRYLLVCLKWIPEHRGGPPYLVTHDEIKSLYGVTCNIESIDRMPKPSMEEFVYLLTKNK